MRFLCGCSCNFSINIEIKHQALSFFKQKLICSSKILQAVFPAPFVSV